ncbi:hypothetical protein F0L74_02355 [Chitinophaga agrisoli]|uniref:PH (Pleckstrin Homology) domain-containing protein n=1 Tax=Chitinophaga agrisoli TaxID=2607653 RepID=A0A5B2W1P6_9BACT|nr:hypothetical protein [Chitinophaga agrisoli]KAA2244828.1 hypothetical protein F0L74_02355 [Chitinophaga agrisoli]
METLVIKERKKKYKTDLIVMTIIFGPLLFWFIKYSVEPGFAIFLTIVLLIIPLFIFAGYIWDVKSKIELSKDGVVLSYGRSIFDIVHFEGKFAIPPDTRLTWGNIAEFDVASISQQSSGGSDGAATTTTNHYLFISFSNQDDFPVSQRLASMRLRRFEKTPGEILALCKQYQTEFGKIKKG